MSEPRRGLARALDGLAGLAMGLAGIALVAMALVQAWQVFARYVRTCIPLPALTERSFWTVTCMNAGLYPKPCHKLRVRTRISVTRPEVFSTVLHENEEKPVL